MIGIITKSMSSGDVLGYDLGDKKNKNQKIRILDSEGVIMDPDDVARLNENWVDEKTRLEFKKLSRKVANDLSRQFNVQAAVNDRRKRKTGHVALSFSPVDSWLLNDEDRLREIIRLYLEKMGIVNTQWVAVIHLGTHALHVHIAYNMVKFDGTVIDDGNEKYRSTGVSAMITKKYGLGVAGDAQRMRQSLSPKQQLFDTMRRLAKEALAESCTMEEYRANLEKRGVLLRLSEYSEQQKAYGLSYEMGEGRESDVIRAKGSKLDRSALSYAKVVATLARNLSRKESIQQSQSQEEAKSYREAYRAMYPVIMELSAIVGQSYELYSQMREADIAISQATTDKYCELKQTWNKIIALSHDNAHAQIDRAVIEAIGGMMVLLNPAVGLLVVFIGLLATDLRKAVVSIEKTYYLSKVTKIRGDIEDLKSKQAQIRLEKRDRLDKFLLAKNKRDEYRQGMDKVKEEIKLLRVQHLKKKYLFRNERQLYYIIHSNEKASLFRASDRRETSLCEPDNKYDEAVTMLRNQGYEVTADMPPGEFYQALAEKGKKDSYRIGQMRINVDGTINFGKEMIFGVAMDTEPVNWTRDAIHVDTVNMDYPDGDVAQEVWRYENGIYSSRIIKTKDGYELQRKEWVRDENNSQNSRPVWLASTRFVSFQEISRDSRNACLRIRKADGSMHDINQFGIAVGKKSQGRLGRGIGGPGSKR